MTRDTREMMGPGAPVVVFCDRSRYLRYTGASLYCGLPTYFFCCDLDDHNGLTLDRNLISVITEDYFFLGCDVSKYLPAYMMSHQKRCCENLKSSIVILSGEAAITFIP
jgi:hypothetical protein